MSRRAIGEGTVYRRKDGRWEGAAYLGTVSGRVRRLRVYGKTRKEAHDKLTIRMADVQRGIPVPDRTWTVGEYLDYWIKEVAPGTLRPTTIDTYRRTIELHLKPRLGSFSLSNLSVATLQGWINEQAAAGFSASKIRQIRIVLSAALTRAMREEIVVRNVARLVILPKYKQTRGQAWTTTELARFLSVATDHTLYPAFLIIGLYGLRRGEALGLRWSDIDWDIQQIHVQQQLLFLNNYFMIGPVKSDSGKRDLPLLIPVRDALRQHRTKTDPYVADDLIFKTSNGQPIRPYSLLRTFYHLQEKAGLRRIRLHDMRHTVATLLKNARVPDRDIQLILGHSRVTTTQELYQHGEVELQRQGLMHLEQAVLNVSDSVLSRQILPSEPDITSSSVPLTPGSHPRNQSIVSNLVYFTGRHTHVQSTPVTQQLRARLSIRFLGGLAVNVAVKNNGTNPQILVHSWIPLRDALTSNLSPLRTITAAPAMSLHPHPQGEEPHATTPGQPDSSSHRSAPRPSRALPPGINQTPTGHGGGY
ncbi:tyrosine-type recombinase/integrase [Nocardia fluminea]